MFLFLHLLSGCFYLLSSAINPFLYSLFSKRFRRGFHDLIYRCNSCKCICTVEQPCKQGANKQNIDNAENNTTVRYNANNDMLTIPKLRGGCLGKQVITRKALHRH